MTVRSSGAGSSASESEFSGKNVSSGFFFGAGSALAGSDGEATVPRPIIVALRAAPSPGFTAAPVADCCGCPSSYALFSSPRVETNLSMSVLESSSILMNFTPMPAGRSEPWSGGSRFQTTRPTPCISFLSSAILTSNFSRVPGGNGDGVLMNIPPRLTS